MPCSVCGYEGTEVAGSERTVMRCDRCGGAISTGESAALFFAKLKLLAQFGLASHTRLLLGTSPQDR